ncbi:MAG TPA: type II toxin-antitoxin system Phd/YefM family antitoxin [Thermoanaerobaculia bacterium]|jgi:antitoxin (DNA-binding transcriptional repressor) of toxin-antitoxin stability system|nr:type II toxin-antitoxin system Phd/YefM family antitoxin [Thermoanaerobaculia bacterium]
MKLTASQLRSDVYRILDRVLETGVPVEIERHGKILRIVPPVESSKTGRLEPVEYLIGDPQEIVHVDWSEEWRP